jgi:Complex I intermediate-associated protein 30 (CIA30)
VSNELPGKRPDERNKSTVTYEYSFDTPENGPLKKFVPWSEFRPFYRGKEVDDAKPLDTERILRWGFMMRSFFDTQAGEFSLKIRCVCSYRN